MNVLVNRQITLAKRPRGYPQESDFKLVESPIPPVRTGEILVQTLWLSLDPYMRGRMSTAKSYARPVELGEVMTGGVVARVTESQNSRFRTGDIVEGLLGWQEYAVVDGREVRLVNRDLAPVSTALGVLGMPGMTAYFGFFDVCAPRAGDTVVVSAAAGAVGQVVGQLAKLAGCRAVGIAGSAAKLRYITGELGFDAGINYKTDNLDAELKAHCPGGVDVYFDNVGGTVTDAVFRKLAPGARVAICGQISQYNLEQPETGPRNLVYTIAARARIQGFLVFDYAHRYPEAARRMAGWVAAGKIKYTEHVVTGLENAPRAFLGLLRGENLGKVLVKVAEMPGD